MRILFAAVHESAYGTKRRFGNVRCSVAFGGKADNICSLRAFQLLTLERH
jgi:hypothetical protein